MGDEGISPTRYPDGHEARVGDRVCNGQRTGVVVLVIAPDSPIQFGDSTHASVYRRGITIHFDGSLTEPGETVFFENPEKEEWLRLLSRPSPSVDASPACYPDGQDVRVGDRVHNWSGTGVVIQVVTPEDPMVLGDGKSFTIYRRGMAVRFDNSLTAQGESFFFDQPEEEEHLRLLSRASSAS